MQIGSRSVGKRNHAVSEWRCLSLDYSVSSPTGVTTECEEPPAPTYLYNVAALAALLSARPFLLIDRRVMARSSRVCEIWPFHLRRFFQHDTDQWGIHCTVSRPMWAKTPARWHCVKCLDTASLPSLRRAVCLTLLSDADPSPITSSLIRIDMQACADAKPGD